MSATATEAARLLEKFGARVVARDVADERVHVRVLTLAECAAVRRAVRAHPPEERDQANLAEQVAAGLCTAAGEPVFDGAAAARLQPDFLVALAKAIDSANGWASAEDLAGGDPAAAELAAAKKP